MNQKNLFFFALACIIILLGCKSNTNIQNVNESSFTTKQDQLLQATVYQQLSAEYRALAYQSYNLARSILDKDLRVSLLSKKRAVIVDVDETVLDNSPHAAKLLSTGESYPAYWNEWCEKANAKPVPGALEFLLYASKNDVDVFYITNRKEVLREATLANLKQLGFPDADDDHLMMRTTTSSKKERREKVFENYRVVVLIGDNLNDFTESFEKLSVEKRFALTDSLMKEFGKRFVVLPNPVYGDWEGAVLEYKFDMPFAEKLAVKRKSLKGF